MVFILFVLILLTIYLQKTFVEQTYLNYNNCNNTEMAKFFLSSCYFSCLTYLITTRAFNYMLVNLID